MAPVVAHVEAGRLILGNVYLEELDRGMRGIRPTPEVQTESKMLAWSLRQYWCMQDQIAQRIGITNGAVSKILARVNARTLLCLSSVVKSHKVAQTSQLEWIISEGLRAWESSKTPARRAASRTNDDQAERQTTEVSERDGETSYLHAAMATMRDTRSIWGLHVAPAANQEPSTLAVIAIDMTRRGKLFEWSEGVAAA
jgi:hypothetical protein